MVGESSHAVEARPADTEAELEKELAVGQGVLPSGRVSTALEHKPAAPTTPFSTPELSRLDEALTLSSRDTGVDFSVYLGDLGENPRERAEELHASIGARAADALLIAVSPGQRKVEIVTGAESAKRLPDRSCKLAVMSMVASFRESDLVGGLISGLRMLTEQAGSQS